MGMKKIYLGAISGIFVVLLFCGVAFAAAQASGKIEFSPTGTTSDNPQFKAVFPAPAVGAEAVGKLIPPAEFPFKVEPAIIADGVWESPTTFVASLVAPLPKATAFKATFKDGTKFDFNTEPLKLLSVSQADYSAQVPSAPEARIKFEFNLPVSPQRLASFASASVTGKKLPLSIQGGMPSRTVYASVKTGGAKEIVVDIAKGLTGSVGTLGTADDARKFVPINPILAINEAATEGAELKIGVSANQPVNLSNAAKFIDISPKIPFKIETGWDNNKFFITGDFKPRQRVEVTLKKGLPSKDGNAKLAQDFVKAFVMPDLPPSISFPSPGTYLSPSVGTSVPIETVNVPELEINLWKLYESNIPYVMRNNSYWYDFPLDLSARVAKRRANISGAPNEKTRRAIDITSLLPASADERGLYLLALNRVGADEWEQRTQVVSLTDIGITVRVWPGGCLVWANSISTAQPMNNARVRIYSAANQLLAQGLTDAQGLCRYFAASGEIEAKPALVTVSKNSDVSFVSLQTPLINNETFDIGGSAWLDGYNGMIFAPRGIYRPGELVMAKVIVREAGNTTPSPFPILFVLRDALGRTVKRGTAMLSANGGASFEHELPNNAPSGEYSIETCVPGKENAPFASAKFSVESFAPPRIEVKLAKQGAAAFITGGETTFEIFSQYLFGVPSSNMPYQMAYRATMGEFVPIDEKFRQFKFGDPEKKMTPRTDTFGKGELDADGKASAELSLDEDGSSVIDLTVTARVMEDSGRWIPTETTYKYFPNDYVMGIFAPPSTAMGQKAEFAAAALAGDGSPAPKLGAKAALYRVLYHYNIVQFDGVSRWQTTEELVKVEEKSVAIEGGTAKFEFGPEALKSWGEYLVRVSAADNQKISSSARFWCGEGDNAGGSRLMDRVELEFDKPGYKPDDVAKVRVRAPFAGTLLFTVENSKLIGQQVVEMKGVEVELSIPLSADMSMASANLWCSAAVLRPVKADEPWAAHRALGVKSLTIDNSASRLALEIDAPERAVPGEKLSVKVKSSPNAEISVALVDEGVLQITGYKTPDPFGFFYAKRAMNSNMFDIYDQLMQIEPLSTPLLHPSGGMAAKAAAFMGNMNAKRFKILSVFKPALGTDSNGECVLEFDIPEFSGRARLFAVSASGGKFGSAEKFVRIGRDIVIEPNLPRFAAIGDTFTSPISVFNTSDKEQQVTLKIGSSGGLEIAGDRDISFTLPAKASKAFDVRFAASAVGTAKYTVNEQEIELPIRGIYPPVTQTGSGSLNAGETPRNVPEGATVTISKFPTVAEITPAMNYVVSYPYDCLEQTVSRAWAAITEPVSENVRLLTAAVANLQSMQLYDGSFARWAGDAQAYKWGSVYAAHFLSELRRAALPPEVAFPEEAFKGVMNYLRGMLVELPEGDEAKADMTAKAYSCFVLALEKEAPLGWMYWLKENSRNLLPSGKIWLAGAYSLAEGKSDELKKLGIPEYVENPLTLDSAVRNTAQQLLLWTMVKPDAPEAAMLAQRLVEWGKASRWFGTQENALCAIALSRYASAALAGKEAGKSYYVWEKLSEPSIAPEPESRGLNVEAVWRDKNGKVVSGDIKLGTEIFVSVRIVPTMPASNIVVSVLLPAGLETETAPSKTEQNTAGFRADARDDRLLLFFDSLQEPVEYRYVVRAVTPGKFALPPITAEGMYSPAFRFVGKGSALNIVK